MYIEINSILEVLFFEKRNRLILILTILAISGLFVWYFSVDTGTPKKDLIETEQIQLSQTLGGVEYASNQIYFFALLPNMYFKISKENNCAAFNASDFSTWCEEASVPHKY